MLLNYFHPVAINERVCWTGFGNRIFNIWNKNELHFANGKNLKCNQIIRKTFKWTWALQCILFIQHRFLYRFICRTKLAQTFWVRTAVGDFVGDFLFFISQICVILCRRKKNNLWSMNIFHRNFNYFWVWSLIISLFFATE